MFPLRCDEKYNFQSTKAWMGLNSKLLSLVGLLGDLVS